MHRFVVLTLTAVGVLLALGFGIFLVVTRGDELVTWWNARGLRSANAETRMEVLEELRGNGSTRAVQPLLGFMMRSEGKERAAAYRALTAVTERDPPGAAVEIVRALERDSRVLRCIACGPVAKLHDRENESRLIARALERLIARESDAKLRRGAISIGSRLLPADAVSVLETAVERDPDEENRGHAVRLLARSNLRKLSRAGKDGVKP